MSVMFALQADEPAELPAGTRLLNGLYQIIEPLQHGGFAMTYIARDSLERHVVIKECFPAGLCLRDNGQVRAVSAAVEAQFNALKQQFLREARGVANLKHSHVVAVHQVFEENNTAYMALDYVAGMDLISVLEDEPERLTGAFIEKTLRATLKAVRHIHSNGILHRDIAPDNIRVDGSDRITLIDFGAAGARLSTTTASDGTVPAVKDGYSPPEFYGSGEIQDFSSDLYSVGATFHHLITGQVPPDGPVRSAAIASGKADPYKPLAGGAWPCGQIVLATIDRALNFIREERLQTADHWLDQLDGLPEVMPEVTPAPVKAPAPARPVLVAVATPAAATPAAVAPGLDQAISKMVQDVNQTIKPAAHAPLHLVAPVAAETKPKVKRWFDIVGNPIEDLTEWDLQEEARKRALEEEILAQAQALAEEQEFDAALDALPVPSKDVFQMPKPQPKSFFGSLIARYLSRSPETYAT